MKTIFFGIAGNSFRKAFAAVALVAAVAVAPAVSAQSVTAQDNAPSITKAADEFQAFVHPVENSVSMKVHFVNPEKNYITIYVYNENGELTYKKLIGKEAIYHGTFDMSKLNDGEYTIKVGSRKDTYSRTLTLETEQKRFALVE
ncbi:hypothetical protein Q0590_12830 [Rhodocytophaga aerolata]|uniref:T9SS type A sorting domain-containing protein n=1 Tax=Rhodocytophaga aerolata TaxID=455078 RepID=A0ABT8R659_9BACT|nr:hypothetical protein [Rhodocytophaga aerolata]MDO1447146.1 hypothetical protein [Rhodocytophaga aerolata]